MTRGAGWRFLDLGRRIERGISVAQAILGVMTGPMTQAEAGLRLALELCDSTNAYLQRYAADARFARALEFVLAERTNPRGLLFQLDRIRNHLEAQANHGGAQVEPGPVLALIAKLEHYPLEALDPDEALLPFLEWVAGELMGLSDAITRAFFTHVASACLVGYSGHPALAELEA